MTSDLEWINHRVFSTDTIEREREGASAIWVETCKRPRVQEAGARKFVRVWDVKTCVTQLQLLLVDRSGLLQFEWKPARNCLLIDKRSRQINIVTEFRFIELFKYLTRFIKKAMTIFISINKFIVKTYYFTTHLTILIIYIWPESKTFYFSSSNNSSKNNTRLWDGRASYKKIPWTCKFFHILALSPLWRYQEYILYELLSKH